MKDAIQQRLNNRGQVGIGTLIVFIAMVLVAAIAAGVLINTAGFLQSKSEQTGQDSTAQVSNRVEVVSGFGNVTTINTSTGSYDANGVETVDEINLTVMRGSGSDDINLSTATIEWIGPNTATTLTKNDTADAGNFSVASIKDTDGSAPVLNSQDDRFTISMNATAISGSGVYGLGEGQTVELRLTTQYGAVTLYRANIPQSLSQESAVTV
ncbi:archaellin/type IV pilin N-terminal domain-containing protein (plasmid) [Haladaptatus sp. SPP-AMP-3]|uniref:archaellin/type IV pilin N-terminal domain-containing protein n=1 Tax=Haladaptatus sp. SPP-AMP-3 TaxID=3121295 RepID=UPI003C2D0017